MEWLSIEIGDETYTIEKNTANPNKAILVPSVNISAWSIVTDTTQVKADPAIKYSWVDLIGAKEQLSYL